MKDNFLCLSAKKQLDIVFLKRTFKRIIQVDRIITDRITKRTTDDVNRERRKFYAVKKELYKFLVQHEKFYKLKAIDFGLNDGTVLYTMNMNYSDSLEHYIKLDDLKILNEKIKASKEHVTHVVDHYLIEDEILKRLETVLGKSGIRTNKNIKLFLENHYLVEQKVLKNYCSNYEELHAYIRVRFLSYLKSEVSIEHINKISFKFQGSIKDFENEKCCGVCLEDYEEGQEICRLPCNCNDPNRSFPLFNKKALEKRRSFRYVLIFLLFLLS